MDPTAPDAECAAIRDDLAALAVGTLTGRDRARVLAHLEGCPLCAAELDELSTAADFLITLIPDATPPEGFSERVANRMRAEAGGRRRPQAWPDGAGTRRRPVPWHAVSIAAVVVVLALGIGIGVGAITSAPGSSGSGSASGALSVRTAVLHSPSGARGRVVLTSGPTGWLVMTLDDGPSSGTVTCTVTLADGSRRTVGRFALASGYGSWAARLPAAASQVRSVNVLSRGGVTIASARLQS